MQVLEWLSVCYWVAIIRVYSFDVTSVTLGLAFGQSANMVSATAICDWIVGSSDNHPEVAAQISSVMKRFSTGWAACIPGDILTYTPVVKASGYDSICCIILFLLADRVCIQDVSNDVL